MSMRNVLPADIRKYKYSGLNKEEVLFPRITGKLETAIVDGSVA